MTSDDRQSSSGAQESLFPSWEANFIQHLVRLREARGMTQTELAKLLRGWGLRFHQQTVQRIEAGERPVRMDEAFLIARALDVELLSMTEDSAPGNDALIFNVDRLRRRAAQLATDLREVIHDWADEVDYFVASVAELEPAEHPESRLVRWGVEWSFRLAAITQSACKAFELAAQVGGLTERERHLEVGSSRLVDEWAAAQPLVDARGSLEGLDGDELQAWIRGRRG